MLFYSSQIPYISFFKNHDSSIFPFSLSLILKSNLMLMKSWNYRTSLCSKENRFFFVPKLLFYTFDIYLIIYPVYSTTVLHFMCSVYADQFSSVLLNDKSTNIVLLHKSFILFASIQSINIVYFNLEAFCCFF